MSLLLHAISPSEPPAEADHAAHGLRQQALTTVRDEALMAWLTAWSAEQTKTLARADLLAHHALVDHLHARQHAVLPARFPTWLADEDAVHALLADQRAAFLSALDHVADRVELAVSLVWAAPRPPEPVPASTAPGRRYMLERQQAQQVRDEAAALARAVELAAGPDVVESRVRVGPHQGVAASIALLVPRAAAPAVAQRIVRTQNHEGVRILVNGPWPPYTFVTLEGAREARG